MRILLSGGGTGGSVTPLLAIAEALNASSEKTEFLWLGSKKGLEKKMVNDFNSTYTFLKHGVIPPARRSGGSVAEVSHTNPNDNQNNIIKYKIIFSGKLRRYFSLKNFVDPIFIIIGFFQSLWINLVFKPDIILTAGSFIAVPVAVSGWLLQIPILMHQQDVEIGLANKLMMPFATVITCSLEEFVTDFQNKKLQKRKTYFTGNAVRRKISDAQRRRHFGMSPSNDQSIPNLLVLGGGTGAEAVNTIIVQSISELTKFFNVIHITGRRIFPPLRGEGKGEVFNAPDSLNLSNSEIPLFNGRYHAYPFLNNIEEAYTVADLVITRAGMGVLSELAVLGKPAIIIPIPDSHQEANAKYFAERNAAVVLDQKELAPEKLTETIKNLLADKPALNKLSENISKIMPRDGAKRIAKIILDKIGGEK